MAKKTGILSLGTRKDATTWENGCKGLGFDAPSPIKKPSHTIEELKAYFRNDPHWIFLAGHFGGLTLLNEKETVKVKFAADKVTVNVEKETITLEKKSGDFNLHKNCQVVLWGGCNVCTVQDTIRTLRNLFGQHVLLGFRGLTGWRVVDAILGAGFIKEGHFFERVKGHIDDPKQIRDAWMQTAKKGYGGGDLEERFSAVDPNGQEWVLADGKIVQGRKIT